MTGRVIFIAGRTEIERHTWSEAVDRAMDVLDRAGCLNDKSVRSIVIAEQAGLDPVLIANKLVMGAKVVRQMAADIVKDKETP